MAEPATYLTQLSLKNVKSFLGDHFLDMTDEKGRPARWTLILGDNGVGKTTLLECLAHLAPDFNSDDKDSSKDPLMFIEPSIAASQNDVIDNLGRNGNIEFEIEATFAVDSRLSAGKAPRDTVKTSMAFSRKGEEILNIESSNWCKEDEIRQSEWKDHSKFRTPLILAYGAGRHMGVGNFDFDQAPSATASLLNGVVALFDVEELLQQIDRASNHPNATAAAKRQKKVLLEMIASLLPEVKQSSNITIYPPTAIGSRGKSGAYVVTSDGEVRLSQLSFGYQTMMAWVSDIGWRLFAHYPKSKNPFKESAIVLVDEIDLHLHPSWQRQVRERLTFHFPNVQFIATAHSPLMAQAFLDENLAVVVRQDNHSIIENDPAVLANWRVDQIVTSDLFGQNTAWPPEVDALFVEQCELSNKSSPTPEDKARLEYIKKAMLKLPTERSPENEEAMTIVREAAALLKLKVGHD